MVFIGGIRTCSANGTCDITRTNLALLIEEEDSNCAESQLYLANKKKSWTEGKLNLELRFNHKAKSWPYKWQGNR